MGFKIGDRVEMIGSWSSVPRGTRGEVRMIRGGDAGVWWEDWSHGSDQGLSGWIVCMTVLRLLESAEELQGSCERILPRRKLFIEDSPDIGEQVVRYFCKPGDERIVKEG